MYAIMGSLLLQWLPFFEPNNSPMRLRAAPLLALMVLTLFLRLVLRASPS